MSTKIIKHTLQNKHFTFNAMAFIPSESVEMRSEWAVFTHGYTASKTDCVSWATRLSEGGIPVCIFDLPGHHLGSYNDVPSFEIFRDESVNCFDDAFVFLRDQLDSSCEKLILGGHSLGALLSLKALDNELFASFNKMAIAIGIGISQHKNVHLFESSFYEKTLNIRRQLVDSKIDSDLVFPWIKEEKLKLELSGHRIHLITGQDDVVVGEGGMEALKFNLEAAGSEVTMSEPRKLPHHEPALAATHIWNFLKKELTI